ncbi:nitroreductase/quinone reductase family protein [Gordonia sp. DT218]|uniref:nitroreductase/quinone reductase family protein n=1 Tax=Gordonia sp. DT218 TaxID=3416659 RepID=UPI003CE83B95
MEPYERMAGVVRWVGSGAVVVAGLSWAMWAADPTAPSSPIQPLIITGVMVANVMVTVAAPATKRRAVILVQRWCVNPLVRALFRIGFVPFGFALVETTGRRTGRPRIVPVGNGRVGDTFWLVAEHGLRAGYVANIRANPDVRVRLRIGLRFTWIEGVATVLVGDDPFARQREFCGLRPLRWWNAMNVRALGVSPVTVRIDLDLSGVRGVPRNADVVGGHRYR